MSKVITVTAALTLVEDRLISLDDPISKYLPQFANMNVGVAAQPGGRDTNVIELVPAHRPITVLDLMRHSSGITYGFFGDTLVKKAYQAWTSSSGKFTNADSSTASPNCRSPISRAQPGITAIRSMCSGASSRSSPANPSTIREGTHARSLADGGYELLCDRPRAQIGASRTFPGRQGDGRRFDDERPDRGGPGSRAAAAWCRRRPIMRASSKCCSTAARSRASASSARRPSPT